MKVLLSPAKKMDFSDSSVSSTAPVFPKKTKELVAKMQSLSADEIGKLMKLSKNLSDLNYQRYQNFDTSEEQKPAALAFDGEVYSGLDASSWNDQKLKKAQETIIILSGLYGVLRPLDLIQPYRLEMGTSLKTKSAKNLYEFWQSSVTNYFLSELEKGELVVNLASNEYAKVINWKAIKNPVITPVFKDFKNGEFKTIMVYAKKARGAMAQFIVENNVNSKEDLMAFDTDGYAYDDQMSKGDNLVFTR